MKTKITILALVLMSTLNFAQTPGILTFDYKDQISGNQTEEAAVWVRQHGSTGFIKTIMLNIPVADWTYFPEWHACVDASNTTAIPTVYGQKHLTWDGTVAGSIVLTDGDYYDVCIDNGNGSTYNNGNGNTDYLYFTFQKTTTSIFNFTQNSSVGNGVIVSNVQLTWTPATTGINEISTPTTLIYSNPSNGSFNIEAHGEVNVINCLGQIVYHSIVNGRETISIDKPGMYIVQVNDGKKIINSRLINTN